MNNRKNLLNTLLTIIFTNITLLLVAQTGEPWTSKDLIEPAALASLINNPKGQKPVIYNIGPLANIKGAVTIGSTATKAGLDKLTKALAVVPKDKMVVIYCGCCPFRNCPNIRPAFNLLKEQGFKNPRLLNLSQNLKVDWTDYGYPME
ncbi:MAG: rhodanese-like domain-containing protein [Bacteroidota bacterium]